MGGCVPRFVVERVCRTSLLKQLAYEQGCKKDTAYIGREDLQ